MASALVDLALIARHAALARQGRAPLLDMGRLNPLAIDGAAHDDFVTYIKAWPDSDFLQATQYWRAIYSRTIWDGVARHCYPWSR